jgi:hypothetical protein
VVEPRIIYVARDDITAEDELNALAAAYRFLLLQSSASRKVVYPDGPENVRMPVEPDRSNEKGSRAAKPGTPNKCIGRIPGDAS